MNRKNYRKPGVYQILNIVTGYLYIGSSSLNIHYRWNDHKSALNAGKHPNRHLQRAWLKYGDKQFEWSVIEYCENSLEREQYWIDTLNPIYNVHRDARGSTGHIRSQETRDKISVGRKGKNAGINHHGFGISRSNETRNKVSQSLKEAYAEGRIVSPMKNGTHTVEARALLSKANIGNTKRRDYPTYRGIIQYTLDGVFVAHHSTARQSADAIGHYGKPDSSKILRACRETHRTCFGYRWRFLVEVQVKPGELLEA